MAAGTSPEYGQDRLREIPCVLSHTTYFFFQFLFPAVVCYSWLVRWRLATSHGKRVGFPIESRWSAEGRKNEEARGERGHWDLETLNRWGARYPEKKARRESSLRGILIRGVE